MKRNACLNLVRLRIEHITFSSAFCAFFALFCFYLICTLLVFKDFGNLSDLSITSCLLYLFAQPSSHYILFLPAVTFLLLALNDLRTIDQLVFARLPSREEYVYSQMITVIAYVVTLVLFCSVVAVCVYFFYSNPDSSFTRYCIFLQSIGILTLSKDLFVLPQLIIISSQLCLIALSFCVLGLALLILNLIFEQTFVTAAILFMLDFLLLLGTKADLPDWFFQFMPYQYLFMPYMNSVYDIGIAICYWFIQIVILILTYITLSKKHDWFIRSYGKEFS